MPRKTKEQKELEIKKEEPKKTSKKTSNTKTATKKTTKKSKKAVDEKKPSTAKKSATKKVSTKKATNKKTTTKKSTTKKSTAKKATSKKKIDIIEYYDLPYRYNQTVVKLLAQTPNTLFIYWDISDSDRENFQKQYGENFFETTKPILIIHNDTLGYSFEVEINDFANSWYLHVADSKCNYRIELGRRPIQKNENLTTDYVYVSMSNEIESPNDHILFNKEQKMVYFRNIKNGNETSKPFSANLTFLRNMGKIYNVYDIYKAIYKNENVEEIYNLSNPSSGNPSSDTFSSRFK